MIIRAPRSLGTRGHWLVGLPLVAGVLLSTGCSTIRGLALQTSPTSETIPAEFAGLPNHSVLVYVWAPPEIQWAYSKVRLDLAGYLSEYLKEHIENISVVDYYRVESYLEKHGRAELDPVDIGRHFGADIVVQVSVYQLSMRDPGLAHFYRGRISASVVVHDLSNGEATPERTTLSDVEVVVPEEGPIGLANVSATQVRQQTYLAFTEKTGRKFHEWERETLD